MLTGVTASGTGKNAGTYASKAAGTDSNYNLNFVDGSLQIAKAPLQLEVDNVTKVYDGTTTLIGAVITPSGVMANDMVSVVSSKAEFDTKDVSDNIGVRLSDFTLTGSASQNYTLANPKLSVLGSIKPKVLTLLGSFAKDKLYDGNTQASVTLVTLSGLVGTETVQINTQANFNNPDIGFNKLVLTSYALSNGLNGGLASNYLLKTENLTASITSNKPYVNPNKPFVNPVRPVVPVSPAGNGGNSSQISFTSGQAQTQADIPKSEPQKQCSVDNPEQCECQETLIPGVSLCVLPILVSVVE